jgi:hypothetical protein
VVGYWLSCVVGLGRDLGSVVWSGGTDGPEGSVLVIGLILVVIAVLGVIAMRREHVQLTEPAAQPQLP